MFKETDDAFLRALCMKTKQYEYSKGDVIVYAGEMGKEMYMIRRGCCDVSAFELLNLNYDCR